MEIFTKTNCDPKLERSALPADPCVAMSYIPFQTWETPYETLRGYDKGTIFPELDKPFYGRRGEPR